MSNQEGRRLYDRWMAMWNGDVALTAEIVAPDCVVHQAPFGAGEPPRFEGPAGIRRMVEMGRAPFADLTFAVEVGPIAEGDLLAARWTSRGRYRGGLPGATAAAGAPVTFGGMDLFRIENGRIAEYWVSADVYHLMAQLGAVAS